MHFFDLNFLFVQGILAQKIYNADTIFCQLRDDSNNQALWVRWLLMNPNPRELAVLRRADLIF